MELRVEIAHGCLSGFGNRFSWGREGGFETYGFKLSLKYPKVGGKIRLENLKLPAL